jgi:hypothetical protein
MVAIPFPVTSAPGANPHESAGRLVNVYSEGLVNGARQHTVIRRAPGLSLFKNASHSGWRGGIVVGSFLYAGFSGDHDIVKFDSTGAQTTLGTFTGTKKLIWARNNAATPDVIAVDPDNGAVKVTTVPTVIAYPDGDVGSPNSVCFLDGYFFFTYGDSTCIASGINTTAINPLDFTTVEGNPGGLLRAIPFGELYLMGDTTIEPYQDTANATGFPFTRVKVIPIGLLGRYAVTGFEPGFGRGIIFVANDRTVKGLDGYSPQKISTPDVDRAIGTFLDNGGSADDIEMFPYVAGGKACVVLRSTTFTWVFDIDSQYWHERMSNGIVNWRSFGSIYAFNKWLVGDSVAPTKISQITETARDELGTSLPAIVESGPVTAFPKRLRCDSVSLDMARGVGIATGTDPTQTDPDVLISWSDDGGVSWSVPVIRKLGRQAIAERRIGVNRVGSTKDQGRRWRITMYDNVDFELTGGDMSGKVAELAT